MKPIKYLILLTMMLTGISTEVFPASSPDEFQPIQDLIKSLKRSPQFKLTFIQDNKNETAGQIIHGEGTVIFHFPNKFLWTYHSPPHNILASDGRVMMLILPEEHQVMTDQVSQLDVLSPINILSDFETLTREYDISPISGDSSNRRWVLHPKDAKSEIQKIILTIPEQHDTFLFRLQIFDLAGNRNTLTFQNYQAYTESCAFRPEIPNGYDVVNFAGQPVKIPRN